MGWGTERDNDVSASEQGTAETPTCWVIGGPNGASKTAFALKNTCDGKLPEPVFRQHGRQRQIFHPEYFELLRDSQQKGYTGLLAEEQLR